jgi:uncharacterized protein (DUF58 family)
MNPPSFARLINRLGRRVKRLFHDQIATRHPGFRTTTEGKIFIAVTFMIGFAAYNTGTNLLYLIFSMMLSLIIVSALMSRSTIRGVEVERLVPTHIVAGEEVLVHLTVRNTKRWFPSLSLRVADVLASGKVMGGVYAVRIPAKGVVKTAYRVIFPRRGVYDFERLVILTRYPFGFTEKSLGSTARHETLVFPPLVDLSAEFTEAQLELGDIETGRRGLGTSLYGLRPYAPGDPARHIHWKVTAKAREVVVREFEREEKKRVTLHLDNTAPPGRGDLAEAFEWAVVFTASLSKFLIDRDYQVQLITQQGRVPFGAGVTHLHRLLRSLAIVELITGDVPVSPFHAAHAADSTNLAIQFLEGEPPSGFDQVLDTRPWRPEGVQISTAPIGQP